MLVIGLSSAALATEDPVDEHSAINEFLNKMDYGFTAVFTFEMIIKVFYFYFYLFFIHEIKTNEF